MLRTFEKDEAHAIGPGIESARVEQLEVEATKPRGLDRDQGRSLRVGVFDQARASVARGRDKGFGMRADKARDQNLAGNLLVDAFDIVPRAAPALLIHNVENARSLVLPQAQIFVASRRQALQMTEHPLPNARFAAVAFPDNGDGRHGAKSP